MKALLKALIPAPARQGLRDVEDIVRRNALISGWKRLKSNIVKEDTLSAKHLLIFPSDPFTVVGALGDDAMISATVQRYKDRYKDTIVSILCARSAFAAVEKMGYLPVELPTHFSAEWVATALRSGGFTDLTLLGADIMDGYYAVTPVVKMLVTADIAARLGIRTIFLGFSFNKLPAPSLAAVYKAIDPGVKFNLRDPQSYERFSGFVGERATLVADSAFLMRPGQGDSPTFQWIASQRRAGRTVIGFNAHAMLIKQATDEQRRSIVSTCVRAIEATSRDRNVAWLLLPHDYREGMHGDAACLLPIREQLENSWDVHVYYMEGQHRAWDLKATAAALDGVVTGRMHLAIASLGSGVPTACLTYQQKFEGLFQHFDLPAEYLMSPEVFGYSNRLDITIGKFLDNLDALREKVTDQLPQVRKLSERTFSFLD